MEYSVETRCQHLQGADINEHYGAVSFPIYQSSTFAHKGFGVSSGYDYSRLQNPTRNHLERIVAGSLCTSVVAKINTTWEGGSSSVLSSALKAPVESI